MCECITKAEEKADEMIRGGNQFKKPVKKVRVTGIAWPIINNEMTLRTCSKLEIELEGQKKKPEMTLIHTYCPFCGEKYLASADNP